MTEQEIPHPPNESGSTSCIVRWMIEIDGEWLGAYNKEAFDMYAAKLHEKDAETITELRAHLPEGMEQCTIVFKECSKGHGTLTATNWIQHECQTCELIALKESLSNILASFQADPNVFTNSAGKWTTLNVKTEVIRKAQELLSSE